MQIDKVRRIKYLANFFCYFCFADQDLIAKAPLLALTWQFTVDDLVFKIRFTS